MAVSLSVEPQDWPRFRVRSAAEWGGVWTVHQMIGGFAGDEPATNGLQVVRFSRKAIPDFGDAILRFHYGDINGRRYAFDTEDGAVIVPELLGREVAIEYNTAEYGATPAWVTVWWGECIAQQDLAVAAAAHPSGTVEYTCMDGLYRLTRWALIEHQVYSGRNCFGHPGYNATGLAEIGAPLMGNREPSGADPLGLGYVAHIWPRIPESGKVRADLLWTDQRALEHALASSRPAAQPAIGLRDEGDTAGAISALAGTTAWPVEYGMTAWDLVTRILDRRRIFGTAFLDWIGDDISASDPVIRILPIFANDLTPPAPAGGTPPTITGAINAGTIADVDLIGDQRHVDRTFQAVRERDTYFDAVETVSEPIKVMVTLCEQEANSLAKRWNEDEQTAYESLSAAVDSYADSPQFQHVYRTVGLRSGWEFLVGDGEPGTGVATRCDWSLDDDGELTFPDPQGSTSVLVTSIADYIPMWAGYDVSSSSLATFNGTPEFTPQALPPQIWRRVNDDPIRWVDAAETDSLQLMRAGNGGTDLQIRDSESNGVRYLESLDNFNELAITVCLVLPNLVRLHTARDGLQGDPDPSRVKRVRIPGYELHLIHPLCIYALDTATTSNGGYAPKTGALGGSGSTPGIARDDRNDMAIIHTLMAEWYLNERRTATWQLKAFGMYGTDPATVGISDHWPSLGELLRDLSFAGRTEQFSTPITSVEYNNEQGITTWITSWSDRDWRVGR